MVWIKCNGMRSLHEDNLVIFCDKNAMKRYRGRNRAGQIGIIGKSQMPIFVSDGDLSACFVHYQWFIEIGQQRIKIVEAERSERDLQSPSIAESWRKGDQAIVRRVDKVLLRDGKLLLP